MQDFKERQIQILVSTVVIEVGVDVPNATWMIVENAERFGLAQLHQLRGRIGRGTEESICILFSDTVQDETVERLSAFESTQSGFDIAEKDLDLRGAGDLIGRKQHGFPKLRIGDFVKDIKILEQAKRFAEEVLEKDPHLETLENKMLSSVLAERFSPNA